MLIFLHLPKTAGTTLLHIFQKLYGNDGIYINYGAYAETEKLVSAYFKLTPEQRSRIQILPGHIPFGIHKDLGWSPRYLTFVRDPVERVLSTYYYLKNNPIDERGIRGRNMSLSDFLRAGFDVAGDVDNGMLRLIVGPEEDGRWRFRQAEYGKCTEEMLTRAKLHLREHFLFVGISEDFTRSLVLLKRTLGWKRIPLFLEKNVGIRPSTHSFSKEELDLISKHTGLDRELYAYAKILFEEAVSQQDSSFEDEVSLLQEFLAEYKSLAAEYDMRISDLEQVRQSQEAHIQAIVNSRFWKFSRPIVSTIQSIHRLTTVGPE